MLFFCFSFGFFDNKSIKLPPSFYLSLELRCTLNQDLLREKPRCLVKKLVPISFPQKSHDFFVLVLDFPVLRVQKNVVEDPKISLAELE